MTAMRATGNQPRLHGNGFTQYYLNVNQRLHIWDKAVPPIANHNATIHDHTWLLKSVVLMGRIEHVTYQMTLAAPGTQAESSAPYNCYLLEAGPESSGKAKPKTHGRACYMDGIGRYELPMGARYSFERNLFHETNNLADKSATLITKLARTTDEPYPRVIAPRGQRPVDAFADHHTHHQSTLWAIIEETIAEMPGPALELIEEALS